MNILKAVLLGILQGISEFIPISSSGHLVLFQKIFNFENENLSFDILLHLGTLIPVFVVFWDDIIGIIKKPFQKMSYLIIVGTLPTVIAALFFSDYIDLLFQNGNLLAFAFIFTGILLLYADRAAAMGNKRKDMNWIDALFVGIMQAVAIVPAVSRSGSTISGALFRNIDRKAAAKFAFLLSIPAILGAAVMQLKDIISTGAISESIFSLPYLFGFIASALSGYLSIKFMLKVIGECKLKYFSYYVFILGFLILTDQFFTHIFF